MPIVQSEINPGEPWSGIAAHHIGVDRRCLHRIEECLGHQYRIDPPPDVALPGLGRKAPPGVVFLALLEQAEGGVAVR